MYLSEDQCKKINPRFGEKVQHIYRKPDTLGSSQDKKEYPTATSQYYMKLIPKLPGKLSGLPWVVSGWCKPRSRARKPSPPIAFMPTIEAILSSGEDDAILEQFWVGCSRHGFEDNPEDTDGCLECRLNMKEGLKKDLYENYRMIPDAFFVDVDEKTVLILEIEDFSLINNHKAYKLSQLGNYLDAICWNLSIILYNPRYMTTGLVPNASLIDTFHHSETSFLRKFNMEKVLIK